MDSLVVGIDDADSKSYEDMQDEDAASLNDHNSQPSGTHVSRASAASAGASTSASKRSKDISPCYVCGAKAHGYNFDQITCESCKAFFRRNALKSMDKFRCRNNNNCVITSATRKRCKRCRLTKCFKVGMRKEWILTEEEKRLKRRKIERNRLLKEQAQGVGRQPNHGSFEAHYRTNSSSSSIVEYSPSSSNNSQRSASNKSNDSRVLPLPFICMQRSADQQLFERQRCMLRQLTEGYQTLCQQYPQPNKFAHRNMHIAQTNNMDTKLMLVKELTRELTQMTTSRLLNYFTLIPEFNLLAETERKSILFKNMLTVFMFHGALTYNPDNDTFVDRTTADEPYDAKYLLFVYGSRVYHTFISLARGLTNATYQSPGDKEADERSHTLFLLLMIVLLFSNGFESGFDINAIEQGQQQQQAIDNEPTSTPSMDRTLSTTSDSSSSLYSSAPNSPFSASKFSDKLHKIQQCYIELACRYLHDEFGLSVGRRMFQNLVPLLFDLQKLCSTLANVNLCELAEDDDRSSSIPSSSPSSSSSSSLSSSQAQFHQSEHGFSQTSPSQYNSTMISGRAHLNELQKENREPTITTALGTTTRAPFGSHSPSPSVLVNTMPIYDNHRV